MPANRGRTRSLQGCLDISAASPRASGKGRGLSMRERQARSRGVDRREWNASEQGRHTVQQRFDGAGTWEVEDDTGFVLFDLRRHLEQGEHHGGGLDLGQGGLLARLGTEGMMEDVGGTRQQEPHGVR